MCGIRHVSNHCCLWWQLLGFASPGTLRMPSCCPPSASTSDHARLAPVSSHFWPGRLLCRCCRRWWASHCALAQQGTASLSLVPEQMSVSQKPLMAKKHYKLGKNHVRFHLLKEDLQILSGNVQQWQNDEDGIFKPGVYSVQALKEIEQFSFYKRCVLKRKKIASICITTWLSNEMYHSNE